MDLYFIHTPLIFHLVLAALQLIVLLIITSLSGVALDFKAFLKVCVAIAVIAATNFFTKDLQLGAFIILFIVTFASTIYSTKGNSFGALIATILLICLNLGAAFFLVAPYTSVEKERIGGATLFLRQSNQYHLPFKLKESNDIP